MTRKEVLLQRQSDYINKLIQVKSQLEDTSVEDGIQLISLLKEHKYLEQELEQNRERLERLESESKY